MFLKKGILFFAILGLLICTGEATAGLNANAVLSLDLIADGGAGNERDDGVTSGTVSGQGTKIAVEVFAKGVTTPLLGVRIVFDFDESVLTYGGARSSASLFTLQNEATGTVLGALESSPATLSEFGFLARAEFTTAVDVTVREFSIGVKSVILYDIRTSSDSLTTTEVIRFNAAPSSDTPPSPDFDGDGMVGIPDFLQFVNVFGSSRGDGTYRPKYDLDGNGVIGVPDFLIFVEDFGKEVSPSGDGEIVSIPDVNLRAVVEDSLNKASGETITRAEMASLTVLRASNKNISDLTGLEFATGLTVLELSGIPTPTLDLSSSILDLSPLSNLTSLTELELVFNSIVDISPLSGLTNLTELGLVFNSIVDISPLSGLTNLTELGLSSNLIVDISPLSGLTNLTELYLQNNSIVDISPLSELTSLTTLYLENILSIPPIPGLVLSTNSIVDISPLSGLTNLTELRLQNNSIPDLSPLVANTGLGSGDDVDVRNIPLSDISRNTHIPALQDRGVVVRFSIDDPTPASIPDASLHAAIEGALGKSGGETITRGDMSNLTRLIARNANISDLTGLEFAFNLKRLILSRNSVLDISPLSGLALTYLDLSTNSILDVSALSELTSLRALYLSNNSIVDISPLVANTGLARGDVVRVRNNPLSDTSINTHIPALQDRGVTVQF